MNKQLLIATLILLSLSTFAQEPLMWQLTEEDGLPSSTVYQTLQDRDGYIWMATANGVCRYDGKEFKRYTLGGLSSNEIIELEEDYWGNIWFLTFAGQLYSIRDGKVKLTDLEERFNLKQINKIKFIDSTLWLSSFLGVHSFSYDKNGRTSDIRKYKKLNYSYAGFFKTNENKSLFYSKDTSLVNDTLPYVIYKYETIKSRPIGFLEANEDNVLYYNVKEVIEERKGIASTIYRINGFINKAVLINDLLWLMTSRGIYVYNHRLRKLEQHFLKGIICNSINRDKEGNYWISTTENGLFILSHLDVALFNAKNTELASDKVFSFYKNELDDNIIVGQNKGIISFVKNNEVIGVNYQSTLDGNISIIKKDQKDDYWISDKVRTIITKSDFIGKEKMLNDREGGATLAKSIAIGHENDIWIAHSFFIFIQKAGYLSHEVLAENQISNLRRTYALHYDSIAKTMWIGTLTGLHYHRNDTILPFLEKKEQIPYKIYDIISTPDSSLWVATEGSGVLQIKNDSVINRYIINEERYNKLTYDQNSVWVAATNGVYKINRHSDEIIHINQGDGLPSKTVNTILADGDDIWLGTNKGLVNFPSNTDFKNNTPPLIHLTAFKIHDKDTILQENYDLTYEQDNITIDFVGLGYRCQGDMTYRYRLLGLDSTWRETKEREIRYPILNAGAYTFEVLAVNEDGTASETSALVSFEIHPAFWQTLWFQLGGTSLIFLIIGSVVYIRLQQKRKRENLEKETQLKMNELRMSALQSQVNPHFIFNALNSIQHYLSENDRTKAMDYLARFAKMIRSIFEQSKEKLISLQEEISFLNLYLDLEKLRFSNKVEVELNLSTELDELENSIKLPPLLIQPILENAFKHGLFHKKGKGHLQIYFELYEKDYLKCTVEDDGVGRKQAASLGWQQQKNHQSSGVGFTQERLNIHNGTGSKGLEITDLSENGKSKGTKVELYIQIGAQTK